MVDTYAALRTAIQHIEHMTAWITEQKGGYSFESLGEDLPGIREALSKLQQTPAAWIEFAGNGNVRFWTDDTQRAAREIIAGRKLRMFTLADLVIMVAKSKRSVAQEAEARLLPDAGAEKVRPTDLRSANLARQAEWDQDNRITLAYRGNELAGEVGEACNVIKKLERERIGIRGSRDTVEHLAEELADVVICADLIAMQADIDLDKAVRDKFNATSEKIGLKTRLAAPHSTSAAE